MSALKRAEKALAEVVKKVEGMAAMGSLELRAAVEGGPSCAQGLLDYHVGLFNANRAMMALYLHVCQLREAQGLPPVERHFEIPPDFGPMPIPAPGATVLTGKAHLWCLLLGSLNGRNLDQIARCLDQLEGWTPDMAAQP